ncbi:hypothetical protein L2E82_38635 [Cichorium intybus]|uniref:Uncharacterized protein n=1 Tax=Cichorium intybus TaxID=13427 RepID=A0ACB9AHA5_CICIN|nr:hypothetical protein L2E82_38635 [Cichorium intybus]
MTMEEILMVKTEVEGEEALRKLVVALNGLAGIAIIKQDFPQAISLYKEALELAEEHSEDFRVDPLLNIHIHYNLAEILPLTSNSSQKFHLGTQHEDNMCKTCDENNVVDRPSSLSSCTSYQSLQITCNNLMQKFLSVFNSRLSMAHNEFRKSYELLLDHNCSEVSYLEWSGKIGRF